MSAVALEHVSKVFRPGVVAVNDLSLAVEDGELVVLVGPSGCGKTTTLRIIAGLEKPSAGVVRIGGRDITDIPPGRRDVAMVFQDAPLYPHMTVRQNLAFPIRAQRLSREETDLRVHEAANMLGIGELLSRRPAALSGGQRQRVALGRTIVRRPGVWLLDEPLSDLEPALRAQLRLEIKLLQRRIGMTTIYVTHDQEEAMALADRLVVMKAGTVQQVGPPLTIYQRPANRFVAGFIGSSGMNFLAGRVQNNESGRFFQHDSESTLTLAPDSIKPGIALQQDVLLGVRPEHLRPCKTSASCGLAVHIVQIEPLGDRANIIVQTSTGARLVWRATADIVASLSPGQTCRLTADPDHLHLFEAGEPGRSLRVDSPDP